VRAALALTLLAGCSVPTTFRVAAGGARHEGVSGAYVLVTAGVNGHFAGGHFGALGGGLGVIRRDGSTRTLTDAEIDYVGLFAPAQARAGVLLGGELDGVEDPRRRFVGLSAAFLWAVHRAESFREDAPLIPALFGVGAHEAGDGGDPAEARWSVGLEAAGELGVGDDRVDGGRIGAVVQHDVFAWD
jgi:hypothetical protein